MKLHFNSSPILKLSQYTKSMKDKVVVIYSVGNLHQFNEYWGCKNVNASSKRLWFHWAVAANQAHIVLK